MKVRADVSGRIVVLTLTDVEAEALRGIAHNLAEIISEPDVFGWDPRQVVFAGDLAAELERVRAREGER